MPAPTTGGGGTKYSGRKKAVRLSVRCPILRDEIISVLNEEILIKIYTNIRPLSERLLRRYSMSEVKCQGHHHSECYHGEGMHFDFVASKPTCLVVHAYKSQAWREGFFSRRT